jgi:hypothetical protein
MLVTLMVASPAPAKVAAITLRELARDSDSIVVATVESIAVVDGMKVATIVPEETLKGQIRTEKFYLLASPTWACDMSNAEAGEHVLLFVNRVDGTEIDRKLLRQPAAHISLKPLYRIANAGRGRMPFYKTGAETYVSVPSDVMKYSSIKTIKRMHGRQYVGRAAPLAKIREAIAKAVADDKPRTVHR